MGHTKGPWVADQGGVCDEQGNDVAVCGELAQWSGDSFHPFKNAEANARLIAASPCLLKAAEAMMARWPTDQHEGSPLYDEAVALRAAIARATGAGA